MICPRCNKQRGSKARHTACKLRIDSRPPAFSLLLPSGRYVAWNSNSHTSWVFSMVPPHLWLANGVHYGVELHYLPLTITDDELDRYLMLA